MISGCRRVTVLKLYPATVPAGIRSALTTNGASVSFGRNEICHGRQGIAASIALRLGRFFSVDPQWFMNMQAKYDPSSAAGEMADVLDRIQPREAA